MGYLFYFLTMTNSRFLYALRAFVGLIFMLSGILKAFSASAFANLMSSYGATWLGYGAPLIIAVELFLGMLLIFNALPRLMSAVSVAFIVIVSAVFLYGVLCRGITDCGCFKKVHRSQSLPSSAWRSQRSYSCICAAIPCMARNVSSVRNNHTNLSPWLSIRLCNLSPAIRTPPISSLLSLTAARTVRTQSVTSTSSPLCTP